MKTFLFLLSWSLAACCENPTLTPDASPLLPDGEYAVAFTCERNCLYPAGFAVVDSLVVAGDSFSFYRASCPDCSPAETYEVFRGECVLIVDGLFDGERYTDRVELCSDGYGASGEVRHTTAVDGVELAYTVTLAPLQ